MIIPITPDISRIPPERDPLSADVYIIKGRNNTWLFDVGYEGQAKNYLSSLEAPPCAVISHFHRDHAGNLDYFRPAELYAGGYTVRRYGFGIPVNENVIIDDGLKLRLFPLPSSHAKGSVGLEVNGEAAFLGDGIYAGTADGRRAYNVGILRETIMTLQKLTSKTVYLSHRDPSEWDRMSVIDALTEIYSHRNKDCAYIFTDEIPTGVSPF